MALVIVDNELFDKMMEEFDGAGSVVLMPWFAAEKIAKQVGLDVHEAVKAMHDHLSLMDDPHGGDADIFVDIVPDEDSYFARDFISSYEKEDE